jgi:conjugative relaxase-like TrwC/TraI family protein
MIALHQYNKSNEWDIDMMTIRVIRTGSERYYLRNVEGEEEGVIGFFRGTGAQMLGLAESIELNDVRLKNLFDARHPITGDRLRKYGLTTRTYLDKAQKAKPHRPCILYDAVVNAPKALSVLALTTTIETKQRCLDLHTQAVKQLYTEIEENCWSRTRGVHVRAYPILVEQVHTRNRALEPHLHSHILILNTALLETFEGGALAGKPLLKLPIPLGQKYRSQLRALVESELGLKTYPFSIKNGESFRIEGISQFLEERFSTRGKQVSKSAKERQLGNQLQRKKCVFAP